MFGALTAYFSTLKQPENYVGIFSFALFLLLLIEAWISIPKMRYSARRLVLFQYGFLWFMISVGIYFVESYRNTLLRTSGGWSFFLYTLGFLALVDTKRFQRWLPTYTKTHRTIELSILVAIVLGVPVVLAWVTSKLLPMILP